MRARVGSVGRATTATVTAAVTAILVPASPSVTGWAALGASTARPASGAPAVLATPLATSAGATAASYAAYPTLSYAGMPTLRHGSRGAAVVTLQRRLTTLHYDIGPVDGVFGYNTQHAVYAFQKVQRIGVDGVVGRITWARLAEPYRPRPRYPLTARSLEVNLTRQVVYLQREGVIRRILDSSTGSGQLYYQDGAWHRAVTPEGRFRVTWRVDGWHLSPLGWMYRPNFFYGGYAVHGSTSVPTYPASHGCVRVTVPAMDRLWPLLRIGMRVAVYR